MGAGAASILTGISLATVSAFMPLDEGSVFVSAGFRKVYVICFQKGLIKYMVYKYNL